MREPGRERLLDAKRDEFLDSRRRQLFHARRQNLCQALLDQRFDERRVGLRRLRRRSRDRGVGDDIGQHRQILARAAELAVAGDETAAALDQRVRLAQQVVAAVDHAVAPRAPISRAFSS
ncbi:MAG: hypothetical protein H6R12_1423 [Proteobacteria bacterium]|nr:hypothetical protein [Pseudomonadota bacterium]